MAKKFDLKKVFLERGEIIGLGLAGVIGVSLLATSLFMPGRGLFGPSADEKIKALKDPAQRAENQLRSPENKPSKPDEIAPSAQEAQARLIKPTLDALVSENFRGAPLGHDVFGQGAVRSMPSVLNIAEAAAKAEAIPLQSYILEVVRGQLYVSVLRDERGGGAPGEASGKASDRLRGMFGGRGGKGGYPGAPGGGSGMSGKGLGMPGQVGQDGDSKAKAKKVVQVPVEKLGSETLAEQVRPLRLAVIAASFPFKKQVEEFKNKLRKPDVNEVLAENSAEPGPNGQAQASFRFLGVRVQRREVDLDGKPGPWKELDLAQDYRPYVILTGKRIEEDDPKYQPVKFPGLVMPKLMQFRPENVGKGVTGTGPGGLPKFGGGMGGTSGGGLVGESPMPGMMDKGKDKDQSDKPLDRYPEVEKELALLNKTLKDLEGKNVSDVVQVTRTFSPDDFDLFGTGTGAGVPPPTTPGERGEEFPPEGQPDYSKPRELPEYCLVRVIDVTVEPGKTYEYQLKIVMANPNYMRKDVASTEYAKTKKIESDWSTVPIKVSVQEDLRYYAVDQKKLEAKYDGINARTQYNEDRQLVMQAHRYLNTVNLRGGAEVLVGEWAVAERFGVYRGEYVGRTERVEVPVWKFDIEDFVVASDSTTSKRNPGISVHFGFNARGDQPEAILVDFDNGRYNYERVVSQTDDKVETKKVIDQAHVEALMMYPDGKLIFRDGAIDSYQEGAEGKDIKQLTEGQMRWRYVKEARKRVAGLKKDKKEKTDRGTGTGTGENP